MVTSVEIYLLMVSTCLYCRNKTLYSVQTVSRHVMCWCCKWTASESSGARFNVFFLFVFFLNGVGVTVTCGDEEHCAQMDY